MCFYLFKLAKSDLPLKVLVLLTFRFIFCGTIPWSQGMVESRAQDHIFPLRCESGGVNQFRHFGRQPLVSSRYVTFLATFFPLVMREVLGFKSIAMPFLKFWHD